MRWAVLDTNVYIDFWERGLHAHALQTIHAAFVVRHAAIVLSELRRGARTQEARRTVESLYRLATEVWEPSVEDWWEAGKLVREIGDQQNWDINKRRRFQNDALLGLTVRRRGALLVTANRSDFRLIERRIGVRIQYL
ncbi:MAG TPA: PIN domain-containing protein [Polyangia bacterium]|nr:PIN domain-containing protein [Polyangia bacterium]